MNNLSNISFLGAIAVKGITSASIFSAANKYFNKLGWKDKALFMGFVGSFGSTVIAELVYTAIIQRILSLSNNAGIKRIFDQALNASLSGALNWKAYDLLVKQAPNIDSNVFNNKEEFVLQVISDIAAEILSISYLNPLLGFDQTSIAAIYS